MVLGLHPAIIVIIIGSIIYFGHAMIYGRLGFMQFIKALKGDFRLSFFILLTTFIVADYFIFTTETTTWKIHLMGQVISIMIGYLLSKQLYRVYRLTG